MYWAICFKKGLASSLGKPSLKKSVPNVTLERGSRQPNVTLFKVVFRNHFSLFWVILVTKYFSSFWKKRIIFSCEAQLNKCTFLSVCLSVCPSPKLNYSLFGHLMTAYDSLWQLMTTYNNLWQLMTTYEK